MSSRKRHQSINVYMAVYDYGLRRGAFRDRVLETISECFSQRACSYHYLRMAENNWNRYILPRDPVNTKKYFYVLRPLLNILWLSQKNCIPPMQFDETLRAVRLPGRVLTAVEELLEKKKIMAEIGKGPRVGLLDEFIREQLAWSKTYCESAPVGNIHIDALNSLFRQTVRESWAG